MYRHSPSRTGFSFAKGPETPNLLWTSFLADPITSSASAADGIVFVGTMGGMFHALEMTTGEVIWTFSAGSAISSSPAVDEGLVFFGTHEPGRIYSLDMYTGIAKWMYEIPTGAAVLSSPAVTDEMVFISSSDGYLRAFTQLEGTLVWEDYIGGETSSSPAVSDGIVFVGGIDVYAFDEAKGTLIWRYPTSWPVLSSPAVDEDTVYVGSGNDDKVYALNKTTGNPLWSYRTGGWLSSPAVDNNKNLVIVGSRDSRVYCLDKKSGLLKWAFITDGPNYMSSPTITTNGIVFIGSFDNNVYCLDEDTGQEIWRYATGGPIISSPTVIHEHVFIGSQDGKLYCFGPPFPIHNIAVLNTTVSSVGLKLKPGHLVDINYTVKNYGNVADTITVTCGYNSSEVWAGPQYFEPTVIHTEIITLEPGANFTNTYVWNTTRVQPGKYNISVQAGLVPDEVDASDNICMEGPVLFIISTDLDANGEVNIVDVTIVAKAFGSRPGDEMWNPDADLDDNRVVNIVDITMVAIDFGKIYL